MTKDEIIRLARDAGLCDKDGRDDDSIIIVQNIEHFAALVIAAERQRKAWDAEYWTAYEQDVAAAERESCAKMLAEEGWLMAATLVRVKK